MPITSIPAAAEGVPNTSRATLRAIRGGKASQPARHNAPRPVFTSDELTDALAETERMASILSTLLKERIVDTGKGSTLTVGRQDADDIRFAAEQLLAMLTRAGDIWRAIP